MSAAEIPTAPQLEESADVLMVVDSEIPATSAESVEALPAAVTAPAPSTTEADSTPADESKPSEAKRPRKEEVPEQPQEPISEVMLRRLTRIKEGDTVLLRLPSDTIKSVTVQKDSLIQLGKYGAFPCAQLIGLHYDITYEIIASLPSGVASTSASASALASASVSVGPEEEEDETPAKSQGKKGGKKNKGKGKDNSEYLLKNNVGWKNVLRPLKRQPLVDAVIDDITETNEFIEDLAEGQKTTLSSEEINELRQQGFSAEEIIQRQIARHEKFGLKTDFSKEKWRKRKEKKFYQTVHPLAPSVSNILSHYTTRAPATILNLRDDTLSQLLTMGNIRPGGRYLVVDDTSGLVTAAVLERMGCEGRIMLFTDSDSPPAWGILSTMNYSERELECIKWLNWMEADEDYQRPPPPPESEVPAGNPAKAAARIRKHNMQVAELNSVRAELHSANWDGLIVASSLSPISVISRLTPYLLGSSSIVAYSPYMQVLAELLNWSKKDPNYLNDTLTESWERTYQVLPGRTHPMMNTSATGGYLWSAIRVHPSKFLLESHQRFKRRKTGKAQGKEEQVGTAGEAEEEQETLLEQLEDEGE
ncbi:hypothetical protein CI109_105204 [Kwoniella shandongensis]|uniref:tRNA (adenine(58)-N(1))-methyltransferase non-catalytic subunit TRM6 n=1 Tax=Kwoniella shandongensis TaxID=1734106 RepID=A0A5M6C498_9TREE|nr:uncharacterized protein CI109_002046 [Kwoniella shandongensis]KAA5529621.1 hypothetical protein CI109_002046 [Kwoniella shandongensis]